MADPRGWGEEGNGEAGPARFPRPPGGPARGPDDKGARRSERQFGSLQSFAYTST